MPGRVLLVGADAQLAALVADGLKLAGDVRLVQASSRDDVLSRIGSEEIEALCVAPTCPDPIALVQHVHQKDRDVSAIILADPQQRDELDRVRLFTPFLGPDVTCRSIEEAPMLGAELSDAATRTRERRQHQATIEVLSQHVDASAPPRPLAGRHFARRLDRAPIGVVTLDANGDIRGWNRRAQDLLDRQERSVGMPLRDLFAATEQDRLDEHLRRGTLADEPQNAEVFELITSDGSSRWVEVSSAVDEESAGDEIIVLLQDVTQRVLAERRQQALEQELQSSRRLLEAVVGGTADAAFIKDRNGRYLLINNAGAAAMGRSADDVVGRTDADLLPAERAARIREDDVAVMETAQAHSFEEMLDDVRVFLSTKSPYYDHTGTVAGVVGTARDITGRKRDEEYALLLNRAGEVLSSLDPEAAVRGVADLAVPDIADFCIVSLVEPSGRAAAAVVAHADPEKVDELVAALAPHGRAEPVCGEVLDSNRPQLLRNLRDSPDTARPDDPYAGCRRLLGHLGANSAIALPLPGHRGGLGTLILARTSAHAAFDEDDLFFGVELARRAAIALENALLHVERTRVAHTLQQSLLPPSLANIPGGQVAVRFHAAGRGVEVGGDFYDVFETAGGYALVIGDVCGKGPGAAAVTALARYTIRAVAMFESRPDKILASLNEALLRQSESGDFCTALVMHVKPAASGHIVQVASAGHPLPLLLRPDGSGGEFGRPGTMLGVIPDSDLPVDEVLLRPGDACIIYTDGLNEAAAPRILTPDNLIGLLKTSAGAGAEAVARRLDVIPTSAGEGMRDDTAIVVFSVDPPGV